MLRENDGSGLRVRAALVLAEATAAARARIDRRAGELLEALTKFLIQADVRLCNALGLGAESAGAGGEIAVRTKAGRAVAAALEEAALEDAVGRAVGAGGATAGGHGGRSGGRRSRGALRGQEPWGGVFRGGGGQGDGGRDAQRQQAAHKEIHVDSFRV